MTHFENPERCFFIPVGSDHVMGGLLVASDGTRAVIDFGYPTGTKGLFLDDVFSDELSAVLAMEEILQCRLRALLVRKMLLDGTLEASTLPVLSD